SELPLGGSLGPKTLTVGGQESTRHIELVCLESVEAWVARVPLSPPRRSPRRLCRTALGGNGRTVLGKGGGGRGGGRRRGGGQKNKEEVKVAPAGSAQNSLMLAASSGCPAASGRNRHGVDVSGLTYIGSLGQVGRSGSSTPATPARVQAARLLVVVDHHHFLGLAHGLDSIRLPVPADEFRQLPAPQLVGVLPLPLPGS
ncbi:unnamed protein product, partial [Prorocentrum cordatum]